ncbi:MAG: hypothetical protein VYE68_09575, partial [Acidobacteriota bacterium]|nr:hypothetical protein [Acidobacteriota bacterium]
HHASAKTQAWLANADDTEQRAVAGADLLLPNATQNVVGGSPALSPDREPTVYFRSASPMGNFWIVSTAGGNPRRITFDTNHASHPRVDPSILASRGGT